MDMSLSKLREMVKDREGRCAAVHNTAKSRTWLSDWTTTMTHFSGCQLMFNLVLPISQSTSWPVLPPAGLFLSRWWTFEDNNRKKLMIFFFLPWVFTFKHLKIKCCHHLQRCRVCRRSHWLKWNKSMGEVNLELSLGYQNLKCLIEVQSEMSSKLLVRWTLSWENQPGCDMSVL